MKDPCSLICRAVSDSVLVPSLLCKPSEGLLSNSGEEKKRAPLKPPKHIPTKTSKHIVYVHVKLTVIVA